MTGRCESTQLVHGRFLRCERDPGHPGAHRYELPNGQVETWPEVPAPESASPPAPQASEADSEGADEALRSWGDAADPTRAARLVTREVVATTVRIVLERVDSEMILMGLDPSIPFDYHELGQAISQGGNQVLDYVEAFHLLPVESHRVRMRNGLLSYVATLSRFLEAIAPESVEGGEQ